MCLSKRLRSAAFLVWKNFRIRNLLCENERKQEVGMMFGKERKVICQILALDKEENLLVLKRSNHLEVHPGEYGIAIYGEVQKDEEEKE